MPALTSRRCGGCWRWSGNRHDATGNWHAGVDFVPADGHAKGLQRVGGGGKERAIGRSVFRAPVRVPGQARGLSQTAVLGWLRAMPVLEATGEWSVCMAPGDQRTATADVFAIGDAD